MTQSQHNLSSHFIGAYKTQFSIPTYLHSRLTYYKRLIWSGAYFLQVWNAQINSILAGTLSRDEKLFHVTFCPDCSLQKIKDAVAEDKTVQITLSFRATKSLKALVLVDFLKGAN